MRTAVVEVGTAALRAVVVEPTEGGWFRVHAEHRVVLGLLRAARRDGVVGEGLLQLAEETARRLRAVCFRNGADVASVRIASGLACAGDLEQLRRRTGAALGADVDVPEPATEGQALLTAVALRTAPRHPATVIELGDDIRAFHADADGRLAGMTVIDRSVRDLLPSGAVDPYHPAVRGHLQAQARQVLAPFPSTPDGGAWPVLTGPTVDALARAVTARRWGTAELDHDGVLLSRAALQAFELELTTSSVTQRMLLPAIDPAEVDLAALGVVLVQAVLDRTGSDGAVVSRARVHDGVVLQTLAAARGRPGCHGDAPPDRATVRTAAITERGPTEHALLTAAIAGRLHDRAAADAGSSDGEERRLLVDAARLHDVRPGPGDGATPGAVALLRAGLRGCSPGDLVELASVVDGTCASPAVPHLVPTTRLPTRRREVVARSAASLQLACALASERRAVAPAAPAWAEAAAEPVT
jgi:exopolyphosphatase/pppGpp-phosphohydrolase